LKKEAGQSSQITEDLINMILKIRQQAKADKNFALSDKIRNDLKELGVTLNDTKDGTTFSIE
jgi:cysteinyl-tRNA synthetase